MLFVDVIIYKMKVEEDDNNLAERSESVPSPFRRGSG